MQDIRNRLKKILKWFSMGAKTSTIIKDDFNTEVNTGTNCYTYSTGEHYEGGWEQNKREGRGTYFYSNGDVYSGTWHKNLKCGYGVYIKANHIETYSGEWRNNSRNGRGCLIQRNGTRYVGSFKQDLRHGPGLSIKRNGQIIGEIWRHGQVVHRQYIFLCNDTDLVLSRRFRFSSSIDDNFDEPINVGPIDTMSEQLDDVLSYPRALTNPPDDHLVDEDEPVVCDASEDAISRSHVQNSDEWTVSDVAILLKFAGIGSIPTLDGSALLSLVDETKYEVETSDFKILMSLVRVIIKMRHKVEISQAITLDSISECFEEITVNYEDIDFDYECGRGGYGKVYKATWMHRPVACKVFKTRTDPGDTQQLSKDFWLELNALSKLRHPNITLLLGVCMKPRYCILTEFVSCGSLFDLIHRHREIPNWGIARIIGVAREICLGMTYLHSQGILHCDLKSSNILITETWGVKIADFGLSFLFPSDTLENIPTAKVPLGCVGTHHWIAPEVLRGEEYSQAADMYSFGVILWEMVHRKIPYQDLTAAQVIGIVGYGGKKLRICSYCPNQVAAIIQKCTVRDLNRPAFIEIATELGGLHRLAVLEVEDSLDSFFGKGAANIDTPDLRQQDLLKIEPIRKNIEFNCRP